MRKRDRIWTAIAGEGAFVVEEERSLSSSAEAILPCNGVHGRRR